MKAHVLELGADDGRAAQQAGVHQKAHGERQRLPAAAHQLAEHRAARRGFVQVHGLGVVLLRKGADHLARHGAGVRLDAVAGLEVFQIARLGGGHVDVLASSMWCAL